MNNNVKKVDTRISMKHDIQSEDDLIKLDCMASKVYFYIILQGFTLAGCHLELNYSRLAVLKAS